MHLHAQYLGMKYHLKYICTLMQYLGMKYHLKYIWTLMQYLGMKYHWINTGTEPDLEGGRRKPRAKKFPFSLGGKVRSILASFPDGQVGNAEADHVMH